MSGRQCQHKSLALLSLIHCSAYQKPAASQTSMRILPYLFLSCLYLVSFVYKGGGGQKVPKFCNNVLCAWPSAVRNCLVTNHLLVMVSKNNRNIGIVSVSNSIAWFLSIVFVIGFEKANCLSSKSLLISN